MRLTYPYIKNRKRHEQVLRLAVPIILSNLSVALIGIVDTAVVGHLPEPYYLGAVAVGALVFTFIYWGCGFLRMGTTGITAQAWGAEDAAEVRATMVRTILIALVLGFTLIILKGPMTAGAFGLIDASPKVEFNGSNYFLIRIWSAPATLCNYVILGWFLGLQNAKVPLVLQLLINSTNILLDVVFVILLGWEVAGVAMATVIAEYGGLAVGGILVLRRLKQIEVVSKTRIFSTQHFKRLFVVNRDIFIRTLCLIFCFAYFTAMGAKLGDVVLAANAVLMNFIALASHGLDGFALAAETLVGAAAGSGSRMRFCSAVVVSVLWALIIAILLSIIYWIAGGLIIDAMTGVSSVRESARQFLPWAILMPVVSVWAFLLDGIFIGTTRTVEMRNAMIFTTILYLFIIQLALPVFGNHGLWLALMALMVVRGISLSFYFPRVIYGIGSKN